MAFTGDGDLVRTTDGFSVRPMVGQQPIPRTSTQLPGAWLEQCQSFLLRIFLVLHQPWLAFQAISGPRSKS